MLISSAPGLAFISLESSQPQGPNGKFDQSSSAIASLHCHAFDSIGLSVKYLVFVFSIFMCSIEPPIIQIDLHVLIIPTIRK